MSKLLTDSYKQVKKTNRSENDAKGKGKAASSTSHASENVLCEDFELLKQFDLSWEYGPCTGITRMERWNRAQKHGLNPPENVRDLITLHPNDDRYTKSLWNDYDL